MNATFDGQQAAGTWQLRVLDAAFLDSGSLLSASMTFGAPSAVAAADVELVNLAGISRINLTLNDECNALVIPEMVLTGDFDFDGNGTIVGPESFDIVVMDSNPSNGPIVDGCGEFQYRVTTRSLNPAATFGFIGDFDPAGANIATLVEAGATLDFQRYWWC